jgi:hypothetical protein
VVKGENMNKNKPKYLDFINCHRLCDGLLREFVLKGLWSSAIISCKESIKKRERDIEHLKDLLNKLEKET